MEPDHSSQDGQVAKTKIQKTYCDLGVSVSDSQSRISAITSIVGQIRLNLDTHFACTNSS